MAQLVVCVPAVGGFSLNRLGLVFRVVKAMAEQLSLQAVGAFRRSGLLDITVYYVDDQGREEYVYSDWDRRRGEDDVRRAMLSLTPVLSSQLNRPEARRIHA